MKILIVGEYSGFARNLSAGFKKSGHESVIVGYGDGWKKIDVGSNGHLLNYRSNYRIGPVVLKKSWMLKGLLHFHQVKEVTKKYQGYFDAILIVNYEFIRLNHEKWYPYFSMADLRYMLSPGGKIYLSACGDDYPTLLFCRKLRYTPFRNVENTPFFKKRRMKIFREVCRSIEGVIPVMFGYADGYRDIADEYGIRVFDTIPLPLDLTGIVSNNTLNKKIVIFHGVNRAVKGTDLITNALEQIKRKYPEQVEVVVDGKMPLDVYLKLLQRTNIIVDQCWGYAYGMNAIYGMAMGKVVLSGNEPECGLEFRRKDIPVINILPEVADIVRKLEFLITHPEQISEISRQSRRFAEDFHETCRVARLYTALFQKNS